MARPGRLERNRTARSFRQLRRFHHGINSDEVFGTHNIIEQVRCLAVWFGVNILFGVGSIAIGMDGASVAWQTHIGGFFAGLVLFSLFDPVPRSSVDAADASSLDQSGQI